MRRLQLDRQLCHAGVLVQADHRPGAVPKFTKHRSQAPFRIDGIQLRFRPLGVCREEQVAGAIVVEHGSIGAAGNLGNVAQIQAGFAQLRARQGIAFTAVIGINGKLPKCAALCQHIVERGGIGAVIQAAAGIGNGCQRVLLVLGRQRPVAQAALLRVQHFHLCAAVAQADNPAKVAAFLSRGRCSIGPNPGFRHGAQLRHLEGVRIDPVQVAGIVDIDFLIQHHAAVIAACRILHRLPAGRVIRGEFRPVGIPRLVINQAAQRQGRQCFHGNGTGRREIGRSVGGGGDHRPANAPSLNPAVFHGGYAGVAGGPGNRFFRQRPGIDRRGQGVFPALEQG